MSLSSTLLDTLYPLFLRAAFLQDAERSHELCLAWLRDKAWLRRFLQRPRLADPVTLAGLTFPNRVGLAAGLDKDAQCVDAFATLGFGFIEVGTVTPRAQAGNARPRLFRIPQAQAVINRFGFNNAGVLAMQAQLLRSTFRASGGILGINLGKNASTPLDQAAADYVHGLQTLHSMADYISINISSPNTQNLRNLQETEALAALLSQLRTVADQCNQAAIRQVPLFVKVAPDLRDEQIESIAQTLRNTGMDGVIVSNTTLSRDAVSHYPHGQEAGGLSGAPLRARSTAVVQALRAALGPKFAIIGVGGIMRAEDACAKLAAGANVVQLYSGLIYRGPRLVQECAQALAGCARNAP